MRNLDLIVYDFDGVMTDNKVFVDQNGNEMIQVNRSDGLGIAEIKKIGIPQIIISTEKNNVVSVRSAKLGIECLQDIENKKLTLSKYCKNNKINLNNVAYVGNDINDKDVMSIVGTKICPFDAHEVIKSIADIILFSKGGEGVVREILDLISN